VPGGFSNTNLHSEHSVEGRLDPFIVDLAAFHPPDYCVVDGLRGLQYQEHNNGRADQMLRNNLVLAGEDPVATDALIARLMGFNPWDMDFLHLAAQREMGVLDARAFDVLGEDADRFEKRWGKPRNWFGRCIREWRITRDRTAPRESWTRYTAPTDTLHLSKVVGPSNTYAAAVTVQADGHRKAFLWAGARGRLTASLNGETAMQEENFTRYRIGQFQKPVELQPGRNELVLHIESAGDGAELSALIVGPRNDGDTVEGIRYYA
jgi:hypothetical protein